jgi:hypothetical protein
LVLEKHLEKASKKLPKKAKKKSGGRKAIPLVSKAASMCEHYSDLAMGCKPFIAFAQTQPRAVLVKWR